MPYLDQELPISGTTPLSRHCSAQGAQDAQPRACRQTRRYLLLLDARGAEGATDWEAARLLGLERTTINARRVPMTKGDQPWIGTVKTRPGPTGVKNAVWQLTSAGRAAVAAMKQTVA
jgi:hypothetical protein